jgi:hypothetical protein
MYKKRQPFQPIFKSKQKKKKLKKKMHQKMHPKMHQKENQNQKKIKKKNKKQPPVYKVYKLIGMPGGLTQLHLYFTQFGYGIHSYSFADTDVTDGPNADYYGTFTFDTGADDSFGVHFVTSIGPSQLACCHLDSVATMSEATSVGQQACSYVNGTAAASHPSIAACVDKGAYRPPTVVVITQGAAVRSHISILPCD